MALERLVSAAGIELRRHGADLLGLCPFHDDHESSLVISPKKNLWHCLGACSAGVSVIDWVMRIEGVSFRHAVELLRDGRAATEPNDQWVQGVIDRKMSVYVGSNPTWENVWDAANGRTTVFGRELQHFQNAGYTCDGWYLVPPGS